tara:strand:- start:346 stop:906 length:561 start_codon:yes stop_codon:yes gene_type:complete
MFTIIQPSQWGKKADLLARIFKTRKNFSETEVDQYDTSSTIYIAYEKPALGVFGSCRLNRLSDSPASDFYIEHYSSPENFIEVSLISFNMCDNHWLKRNEGAVRHARKLFYNDLYQILTNSPLVYPYEKVMHLDLKSKQDDITFPYKEIVLKEHGLRNTKFNRPFLISELPVSSKSRDYSHLNEAV